MKADNMQLGRAGKADKLLTPEEVSRLLNVHQDTLRRWRQDGTDLPYLRIRGTTIRYRISDVEAFMSNGANAINHNSINSKKS